MPAGKYRTRLQVQRNVGETATADAYGRHEQQWVTIATIWAEVLELDGSEFWRARQVESKTTHQVKHRYYKGLTTKDRYLLEATRILQIDKLTNPDKKKIEHKAEAIEETH